MDFKTFLKELSKFPEQTVIQTGHAGRTFQLTEPHTVRPHKQHTIQHIYVTPSSLQKDDKNGLVLIVIITKHNHNNECMYMFGLTALSEISPNPAVTFSITRITTEEAKLFIEIAS